MKQNNVLIIDQGESILVNLTHFLDRREVSADDEPFIFSARTVADAEKILQKSAPDDRWKIVVIGREGGIEPQAQTVIEELAAKFGSEPAVPILLVTKTSAAFETALKGNVRGKADVARVDPDTDFDLADVMLSEGYVPKEAEAKFDHLIERRLKDWLLTAPESAAIYPVTPPPKSEGRGFWGMFGK